MVIILIEKQNQLIEEFRKGERFTFSERTEF